MIIVEEASAVTPDMWGAKVVPFPGVRRERRDPLPPPPERVLAVMNEALRILVLVETEIHHSCETARNALANLTGQLHGLAETRRILEGRLAAMTEAMGEPL